MTHFRYPQILRGHKRINTFTTLRKAYYKSSIVTPHWPFKWWTQKHTIHKQLHSSHPILIYMLLNIDWCLEVHDITFFKLSPAHIEQNTDKHTHIQMSHLRDILCHVGCGRSLTLMLIVIEWLFRAFSSSVMLQALLFPDSFKKRWCRCRVEALVVCFDKDIRGRVSDLKGEFKLPYTFSKELWTVFKYCCLYHCSDAAKEKWTV